MQKRKGNLFIYDVRMNNITFAFLIFELHVNYTENLKLTKTKERKDFYCEFLEMYSGIQPKVRRTGTFLDYL